MKESDFLNKGSLGTSSFIINIKPKKIKRDTCEDCINYYAKYKYCKVYKMNLVEVHSKKVCKNHELIKTQKKKKHNKKI